VARLTDLGGIPKPMTPAESGGRDDNWRKVVEFARSLGGLTRRRGCGIAPSPAAL